VFSKTETYKRGGKWGIAGSPKRIKEWYVDPTKVDNMNESLQLNHYRLLAEKLGYKISRMQLQITVRDGGLQIARERGITELMYYPVEIPRMSDADVEVFYQLRAEALIYAIANDEEPPECDDQEAWDGTRCVRFCDVADFCSRGFREKASAAAKGY
jgi:hypothetical protein